MWTNVMVVDDHSLIRLATEQLVDQQSDMKCVGSAPDLATATKLLDATSTDVVLCDLQFSTGNALGFIAEFTKKSDTRFLVCSAHRPEVFSVLCAGAGASGYIHKSNHCEKVIEAIRYVAGMGPDSEFLGREQPTDGNVHHRQLASLTPREWEVLNQIGHGAATKEIAKNLFLSAKTIESHRASIKRKLAIESKDYLVSFAAEMCFCGVS